MSHWSYSLGFHPDGDSDRQRLRAAFWRYRGTTGITFASDEGKGDVTWYAPKAAQIRQLAEDLLGIARQLEIEEGREVEVQAEPTVA
jgi:hypothetical protein